MKGLCLFRDFQTTDSGWAPWKATERSCHHFLFLFSTLELKNKWDRQWRPKMAVEELSWLWNSPLTPSKGSTQGSPLSGEELLARGKGSGKSSGVKRTKISIRHPELADSVNLGTVIPGLSFLICKMEIKSLISWDYCKDQNRHVLDD